MKKYPDSLNIRGATPIEFSNFDYSIDGEMRNHRGVATVRIPYDITFHYSQFQLQDEYDQTEHLNKKIKKEMQERLKEIIDGDIGT